MKFTVLHLYDEYLNIYADRGNIAVLTERARWRGIECEVRGLSIGESFDPGDVDLIYVGGGQDRDQAMIAEQMASSLAEPIREAVDGGTALLAVCGGYQLLGEYYLDTNGHRQPGIGLMDHRTEAGSTRLIGNVLIEAELPAIGDRAAASVPVAGFENHAGRTMLGESATALGRVVHGYGNDGVSGFEGCRRDRAIGTYLHGPLLPRNPELADWLIAAALAHAYDESAVSALTPLDDALAFSARDVLIHRAQAERRVKL